VSHSKTEGGTGRIVPLTRRACAVLTLWLGRFTGAQSTSHVFPKHQVGFAGHLRRPCLYNIDLTRPMAEWKSAWEAARRAAGVDYRWHDLRHTFISRLAENPRVSEQTITSLAGHVSKRMLERYNHIRARAKRDAISMLESARGRAQNWAQSPRDVAINDSENARNPLNLLNNLYGAGDRFRTDDLVLGKHTLYQLSYTRSLPQGGLNHLSGAGRQVKSLPACCRWPA
jgi:hypothetical protein